MKPYTIKTLLSLACSILLITSPLRAQSSQVHYDNPEHTSGYLTLSAADCTDPWWMYDWVITTPANAPVKVTVTLNYYDYLDVYTYGSGIYQSIFSDEPPGTTTKTVISSDGKIYVYCCDHCNTAPTFDVFTITFEVDSTIYSATDNLHVPGSLSVVSNLDVLGNTTIAGNTRINNRLGIGANPYDSRISISNYNQDNRAISISSSKNTSSALYGLYSYASNGTGNVYGIYSKVSGVKGKKWAGYFDGGDVEINNGNLRLNNNMVIGPANKQFIFHTQAWLPNNPPIIFIAPKLNDSIWDWSKQIILNHEGSILMCGGKLGIGTRTPRAGLHVVRHDTINANKVVAILGSEFNHWTYFGGVTGGRIRGSNEGYLVIGGNPNGTGNKNLYLNHDSPGSIIMAMGGGKVGIGTAQIPSAYKLAVAGKILAEEVVVELQENWPDYVFKTGYELMPLHQVEKFVQTNQHLPGIPSASQVKDKGLSIGQMQHLLLQKIEELTLYIIEQDKKIKSLEEQLK